jgi:hypothetical protein
MSFGVHYSQMDVIIGLWGPCIGDTNNGAIEIAGPGWPANDTGTSMVFQYTQTNELVECYFFGGYNYYGVPSVFQLRDHPDPILGGKFADDSIPSLQDDIAGYGSMGLDTPGQVACPGGPEFGACCFCNGTCLFIDQAECDARHGMWLQGYPCDPNPCPAQGQGACCYPDGHCEYVCDWECPTGVWLDGRSCEPNPCEPPNPTRTTTWGGIKATFR